MKTKSIETDITIDELLDKIKLLKQKSSSLYLDLVEYIEIKK